jgi:hypothetical protein
VNNSELERRLLAALPAREGRQRRAIIPSLPAVYGFDSVPASAAGGSGEGSSSVGGVLQSTLKEAAGAASSSNQQLSDLEALQEQLLKSTGQTIGASNSTTQSGGGSSTLSSVGGLLGSLLGQGSILSPILSGIMSLFGGGSSPSTVLSAFEMPSSVNVETAINQAIPGIGQGQTSGQTGGGQTSAASQQPIQVQVSAMDSQSFLDHSSDIANAVRRALLDSHPLSDVIAEL